MKKLLFAFIFCFASILSFGQEAAPQEPDPDNKLYTTAEDPAGPVEGINAFIQLFSGSFSLPITIQLQ